MKRLLAAAALAATMTAQATDFGQMQTGVQYTAASFQEATGYYTATTAGTLTVTTLNSTSVHFDPYKDSEHIQMYSYQFKTNFAAGQCYYTLDLEAGTTVYLYASFPMSSFTTELTMTEEGQAIPVELVSVAPTAGEAFNVTTSAGQVTVNFSRDVRIAGPATLTYNGQQKTVETFVSEANGLIARVEVGDAVSAFIEEGAQRGDTFTLEVCGIADANDATNLYNGDGRLVVSYLFGGRQPRLIEDGVAGHTFKSYYMTHDEEGLFSLVFDQQLATAEENAGMYAYLECGSREGGSVETGTLYHEDLDIIIDDCTLSIDMRGKLRTGKSMLPNTSSPQQVVFKVGGLKGSNGEYVKTEAGYIGSYAYVLPFYELKNNTLTEWSPVKGQTLRTGDAIEVWVHSEHEMYLGNVTLQVGDEVQTTDAYTAAADPEDKQATIYTIKVPQFSQSGTMTVAFADVEAADGRDYSASFVTEYAYEYTPDAITTVKADTTTGHPVYYDLMGRRMTSPRGIVITSVRE